MGPNSRSSAGSHRSHPRETISCPNRHQRTKRDRGQIGSAKRILALPKLPQPSATRADSRTHDRAPPRAQPEQAAHPPLQPTRRSGLENRYPSFGGSRVQIPPPPLNGRQTRWLSGLRPCQLPPTSRARRERRALTSATLAGEGEEPPRPGAARLPPGAGGATGARRAGRGRDYGRGAPAACRLADHDDARAAGARTLARPRRLRDQTCRAALADRERGRDRRRVRMSRAPREPRSATTYGLMPLPRLLARRQRAAPSAGSWPTSQADGPRFRAR